MKKKQELIEEWESAIEAAEFYGKGKEERLISYMKDFVSDLKQLDEPEVLTKEWIDEHKHYYPVTAFNNSAKEIVDVEDLQNLLVPKRELPVIPKFVADWYENHKDNLEKQLQGIAYNLDKHGTMPELNDLDKWINEMESPLQTLASLKFGYEVKEEEQKYRVIDRHKVYLLAKEEERNKVETVAKLVEFYGHEHVELNYHLTEQEIKDYDPRYWSFAVKVEELEE